MRKLTKIFNAEGASNKKGGAGNTRDKNRAAGSSFESDEHMQLLLDAMPYGANLWNEDCQNVATNAEAVRLFGLSSKQEYLDRFFDLSPKYQPDGQLTMEKGRGYLRKAFSEGYACYEWLHRKLDGELLPCEVTLVRVEHDGKYVVAGFIRDLRREKAAAEKIRESQEEILTMEEAHRHLQTMLDLLPVGVVITRRKDGAIMYMNKAGMETVGCSSYETQLDGQSCLDLMPQFQPDGRKTIDILTQLWSRDKGSVELQINKLTGGSFLARVAYCFIAYYGASAVLNVIEDMTEERKHQSMLETIALKEQEANQLKTRFLANMSHEVRTPMNAIMGIAEIQLQNKDLPAGTAEAMRQIFESGTLLLNIINDILDLSKIEADKLEIIPAKYDLPSLINDTIQINRLRYDSKPIEFFLEIDENLPLNMMGDELRIKQVLNNILSNAFKYTDSGEVKLKVWAEGNNAESRIQNSENGASEPGDSNSQSSILNSQLESGVILVFEVSDTGQGLTEEQIGKLFTEYMRFNLDVNRSTVGTGLGMTITKRLVGLMDGEITVESAPGKGSVFTVRFPQKLVDSLVCGSAMAERLQKFRYQSTGASKRSRMLREYMPYGSVLVVDDVESNIYVAKGMLVPYGLKIDSAASGFEAIEKIKAGNTYDIIFMDHMMPRMGGIETVKNLRGIGYDGSIVALTANALVGSTEMFLRNGFDGYISKPIDSRELNQVLNELIRNKKPPEVVEAARQAHRAAPSEIKGAPGAPENGSEAPDIERYFIMDAEDAIATLTDIFSYSGRGDGGLSDEDLELYEITVHGVKSALANIGRTPLSGFARTLEHAAKQKDTKTLKENTPLLINELKVLIKSLQYAC